MENRYSLTLAVRLPRTQYNKKDFLRILTGMPLLTFWEYLYIRLETERYRMEQHSAFEDRLPAGWMLFLLEFIECSEIPSAPEVVYLAEKSGTIIITKEEFNGKDVGGIICANNVEIELAANGHLPKWFDL